MFGAWRLREQKLVSPFTWRYITSSAFTPFVNLPTSRQLKTVPLGHENRTSPFWIRANFSGRWSCCGTCACMFSRISVKWTKIWSKWHRSFSFPLDLFNGPDSLLTITLWVFVAQVKVAKQRKRNVLKGAELNTRAITVARDKRK